MTPSPNAVPQPEIAADGSDGGPAVEMDDALIEEVSIDGLCGVY